MSRLTKIFLITILSIISTLGIMVRKDLGITITTIVMIVLPLMRFIWNRPSSKNSFSDTENYQQPFNKWQNNASPQQGGFYNGGHNAGHQPHRSNPVPQQPQQQLSRKNNRGDFNGELYGKAK